MGEIFDMTTGDEKGVMCFATLSLGLAKLEIKDAPVTQSTST